MQELMESPRSLLIEKAFRESLQMLCVNHSITMPDLTVLITFSGQNLIRLQLCRKDIPKKEITLTALCCPKMVSLRFTLEEFAILLQGVHIAFMKETATTEKPRIALILYYSAFVNSVCIGILMDSKPIKALLLAEVIEAMHLGYEQLN